MPYSHYMEDPNTLKADSIFFYASNLSKTVLNIEARHVDSEKGVPLQSTNFVNNAANVPAEGFAKRRFLNYNFSGLTGKNILIKREYELRESGISSKYVPNDKITVYQEFNSCYAYDDGTAEYGFGYEDDVIDPFLKGAIAYKFKLAKSDSLLAIGMFFNQSVKTSEAFSFDLKVWQSITGIGQGRDKDVSLFTLADAKPRFTDSINGFAVFFLDTPIVLPKGDFYIGWEQVGNNHLDVGYDINNGNHESESSDNLYWVDRGNWKKVDNFKGALMMRPYFGAPVYLGTHGSIGKAMEQKPRLNVYPNPFNDMVYIESDFAVQKIEVYNSAGQLVFHSKATSLDLGFLVPGVYNLQCMYSNGQLIRQKIVKLH